MAEDDAEREGEVSYVKEAFRSQYNWIGLVGAGAFAVISGSALPLLLAAGLELMYLSIIPQNSRYQRLVRSRKYAREKRQAAQKLAALALQLPVDMRARYTRLHEICATIRKNYAQLSSTSRIFAGQMEERLNGILQGFLRLLVASQTHREYLKTASPEAIEREIVQLEKAVEQDPPKVQEINRHRIGILRKRLEKFRKIAENHQVIEAQCAALQDVLELIRDQSVTMKDPQQVSDQLGNLVRDVEQTEEAVREVESILELATPEMDLLAPSLTDQVPSGRTPEGRTPESRKRSRS